MDSGIRQGFSEKLTSKLGNKCEQEVAEGRGNCKLVVSDVGRWEGQISRQQDTACEHQEKVLDETNKVERIQKQW